MSAVESQTPSPAPAAPKRRLRRVLIAGAFVLSGFVIGVGTSALSQGYGMGGWRDMHHGWSHDGWFGGGPRGPFGEGAGRFFQSRVERVVGRVLSTVDASAEQKEKVSIIAQRAMDDLRSLRDQGFDLRKQMGQVLSAPTIDRGKLESIRAEKMRLAEQASKRIVDALAEAGDVLTPAQRADLGRLIEARRRWLRG